MEVTLRLNPPQRISAYVVSRSDRQRSCCSRNNSIDVCLGIACSLVECRRAGGIRARRDLLLSRQPCAAFHRATSHVRSFAAPHALSSKQLEPNKQDIRNCRVHDYGRVVGNPHRQKKIKLELPTYLELSSIPRTGDAWHETQAIVPTTLKSGRIGRPAGSPDPPSNGRKRS
jgi:hypothetical protein